MMQQHLQAIVTVLSLVNPLICGAMFAQIEAGQTSATRLADATKAALAVLVILVIAALVGARVLHIFGVSLDAFRCWRGRAGLDRVLHVARQVGASSQCGWGPETVAYAVDLVRGQSGHDNWSHHARRRPYEVATASHGTRSSSGGHGRNVDCDAAREPRGGNSRRRRLSARHGDAVHGTDCHRHGHAVCADRPSRFFRCPSLVTRTSPWKCERALLSERPLSHQC